MGLMPVNGATIGARPVLAPVALSAHIPIALTVISKERHSGG
jgi:hypothetical protein